MVRKMVLKKGKKELDTTEAVKKGKDKKTDPKKTKEGKETEEEEEEEKDEGLECKQKAGLKRVYRRSKRGNKRGNKRRKENDDVAVEGIEIDETELDTTKAVEKKGDNVNEKLTDDCNDGEEENDDGSGERSVEEKEEASEEVEEKGIEEDEDEEVVVGETEAAAEATSDGDDIGEVESRDIDSRGKSIHIGQDEGDDDEDSCALQPEKMHFNTSDYTTSVRIATRCKVGEAVQFLEQFPVELKWLRNNEQFKHIFHLPEEPNHQVQALWMLILRKTWTEMQNECWFLVNGKLIRYSIREHALLTGLNCKAYPPNWDKLGSLDFASRVFNKKKGITISKVEKELLSMKNKKRSGDRMKLAVLYFLAKVLKAKNKYDPGVDTFLLRIVDDLSICEKFPWGRYTFNDCIESIKGVVDHMKGGVKKGAQPGFNGFIIPPEILAFECIPRLGRKFREDVGADLRCPRMCKRKFVRGDSKGYTLDEINEALGDDTEIISILQPTKDEVALMRNNLEDDVDDGLGFIDMVVESWRKCLLVEKKDIFWKDWHKKDVEARASSSSMMIEGVVHKKSEKSLEEVLLEAVDKGFAILMGELGQLDTKVVEKLSALETKVQNLQNCVMGQRITMTATGGSPGTGFVLYSELPLPIPTFDASVEVPGENVNVKGNYEDGVEKEQVHEKDNEEENVEEEVLEKENEAEKQEEEVHDGGKEKEEKKREVKERKRKERECNDDNQKLVLPSGLKRQSKAPIKYTPGE